MIRQLDEINPKGKRWVFTIVNYDNEDEEIIQRWAQDQCKYLIYGREVAPTTGTPHLQGYMHLHEQMYRRTIIRLIHREGVTSVLNFLQPAKGSLIENRKYCSKEGNFCEHGELPAYLKERKRLRQRNRSWMTG